MGPQTLVRAAALAAAFASFVLGGQSGRYDDRHPAAGAIPAPPGVPASYVLTHNGWFHSSCVVRVRSDEVVGADRRNSAARTTVPRTSPSRRAATRSFPSPRAHDGWWGRWRHAARSRGAPAGRRDLRRLYRLLRVRRQHHRRLDAGHRRDPLPAPTNVANQDIAFFNDITTTAGGDGGDILQPVLDFNGETRGKWSIQSEHCCISGNDMQTTPIVVLPAIRFAAPSPAPAAPPPAFVPAHRDHRGHDDGQVDDVEHDGANGVPHGVSPGSLETYGVMSCDMFPAGGRRPSPTTR